MPLTLRTILAERAIAAPNTREGRDAKLCSFSFENVELQFWNYEMDSMIEISIILKCYIVAKFAERWDIFAHYSPYLSTGRRWLPYNADYFLWRFEALPIVAFGFQSSLQSTSFFFNCV